MMGMTFKSNTKVAMAATGAKTKNFLSLVQKSLDRAAMVFIGNIQETQMTGHYGPGGSLGTAVRTGMLRRGWFKEMVIKNNNAVLARIWSTTPYAPLHEYGGVQTRSTAFGKPANPYMVFYHKRLFIGAAFLKTFPDRMKAAVQKSFNEAFA